MTPPSQSYAAEAGSRSFLIEDGAPLVDGHGPTPRPSRSTPEPTLKPMGLRRPASRPPAYESGPPSLTPKTHTMQTQTPQPNNPSPPRNPPPREACPPMADHSRVVGSKMSKMRLGVRQGVNPSPVQRVGIPSPLLKQSNPCLKSQNNQKTASPPFLLRHAKSPEIPLGVVQSKQLRVQSTFNQTSTASCGARVPSVVYCAPEIRGRDFWTHSLSKK